METQAAAETNHFFSRAGYIIAIKSTGGIRWGDAAGGPVLSEDEVKILLEAWESVTTSGRPWVS